MNKKIRRKKTKKDQANGKRNQYKRIKKKIKQKQKKFTQLSYSL